MHEASTFAIGSGRKRCGGDNRACIEQNIGGDGGKARALVGEGGRVSNEDRNVIIGIRFRLAARARAEQHNALNAVAVNLHYGSAEASQDLVILALQNRVFTVRQWPPDYSTQSFKIPYEEKKKRIAWPVCRNHYCFKQMRDFRHQIGSLSTAEKIELLDTLWESLEADEVQLTEAQRAELDYRIAQHDHNTADVIPWEQVRTGLFKKP
jgi:putative addiction module component (TIGR02574 family)